MNSNNFVLYPLNFNLLQQGAVAVDCNDSSFITTVQRTNLPIQKQLHVGYLLAPFFFSLVFPVCSCRL